MQRKENAKKRTMSRKKSQSNKEYKMKKLHVTGKDHHSLLLLPHVLLNSIFLYVGQEKSLFYVSLCLTPVYKCYCLKQHVLNEENIPNFLLDDVRHIRVKTDVKSSLGCTKPWPKALQSIIMFSSVNSESLSERLSSLPTTVTSINIHYDFTVFNWQKMPPFLREFSSDCLALGGKLEEFSSSTSLVKLSLSQLQSDILSYFIFPPNLQFLQMRTLRSYKRLSNNIPLLESLTTIIVQEPISNQAFPKNVSLLTTLGSSCTFENPSQLICLKMDCSYNFPNVNIFQNLTSLTMCNVNSSVTEEMLVVKTLPHLVKLKISRLFRMKHLLTNMFPNSLKILEITVSIIEENSCVALKDHPSLEFFGFFMNDGRHFVDKNIIQLFNTFVLPANLKLFVANSL